MNQIQIDIPLQPRIPINRIADTLPRLVVPAAFRGQLRREEDVAARDGLGGVGGGGVNCLGAGALVSVDRRGVDVSVPVGQRGEY